MTRQKRYRIKHRQRHLAQRRAYYVKTKSRHADCSRKHKYGLDYGQYDRMLEYQGGLCALCKRAPNGNRPLAVDHDHQTGKVRGLLCISCNRALGCLGDNEQSILKVLEYLRRQP